ncbi:hypothetical protein BHE74_00029399 [Ensete ventricosum]|nr:hypothetical protein BHE74_00029399 [Ensete ventricosum]
MSGLGSPPLLNDELSKRTAVFGLHMWVVVGICVGAAFVLLLFLISLWLASRHGPPTPSPRPIPTASIPIVSKEIQEIRVDPSSRSSAARPLGEILRKPLPESDPPSSASIERQALLTPALEEESPIEQQKIHIEIGKGHRIMYPERGGGGGGGGVEGRSAEHASIRAPEVSHLGWGHWYTLRELEVATNMFADENVIGEGGYGIVYHGVLQDTTQVAVKNLLNNRLMYLHEGLEPKERQTNETYRNSPLENAKPLEIIESGDSSGHEGNTNVNRPSRWRKQDN